VSGAARLETRQRRGSSGRVLVDVAGPTGACRKDTAAGGRDLQGEAAAPKLVGDGGEGAAASRAGAGGGWGATYRGRRRLSWSEMEGKGRRPAGEELAAAGEERSNGQQRRGWRQLRGRGGGQQELAATGEETREKNTRSIPYWKP
jgi:hypothetical protein